MFWKKRDLEADWQVTTVSTDAIIWKLLISPNGILTGEERDPNAKQGTLFAIDVVSGKILWRLLRAHDDWWFNSEQVTEDTLFVQGFRAPNHPEPLGIYAIDLETGNERWRDPELVLLSANASEVLAAKQTITGHAYYELDATNGAVTQDLGPAIPAIPEALLSRETLFAEHADRNDIAKLDVIDLSRTIGPIDSQLFNDYLILAFHVTQGKNLQNELLIYDRKQRRVCYRETLHHETPLPLPENFFVSHGFLLYVKEKRTVVGVDLRRKP